MEYERIYVSREAKKRLKTAKERYGNDMIRLFDEAVLDLFSKDGRRKKATLSEKTQKVVKRISERTGRSPDEVVMMAIKTVRTLFDPRLSFGDALRTIPELAEEVFG